MILYYKEYNDAPDKKGNQLFKFDSVKVVSAGERDPDAEGVEGMSASKMRAAAADGKFDDFKTGIPATLNDADKKKLYFEVRKNMGIREDREMGDDYDSLRDAYLTGKIWNVGEVVEAKGNRGEVVRKGTNYLSFVTEDGKVHKAWLHEILVEEITKKDLDQVEKYADKIFAKVGIDVEFTRHFMDRVNDARNKKPITTSELTRLFKQSFKKYGKKIAQLGPDAEAVINDMKTNVNMPFVLNLKDQELELVAKTVMRKKDFKTSGPKLSFEDLVGGKQMSGPTGQIFAMKTEEVELDEMAWFNKAMAKIDQMMHPKNYEDITKAYVKGMKNKEHKKHPSAWASEISREYDVSARSVIMYINNLVSKGILPKDLKAEYQSEQNTFADLVNKINEVKQDKDVKDKEGTQPAKYYAGDMAKSTKDKRDAHFKSKKGGPAPGDATAKTKPSKHTKKFKQMFGEEEMKCPPATQDLAINTKNRDATTKKYNYGPLNVDEPGDYWKDIAKHWKTTEEAAKKSLCSNCVAFDISERMKDCLPGETSDEDGELGYCWMHHFKCHSARACHTWAKGGPIKKDEDSYDWQERAFGKKEVLGKDADQGDYIDDFQKSDAPQFKGKSKEKRKEMAIAAYLSKNESLLDNVNKMLSESGHTDVASMKNKVQIAMSALQKMEGELGKLGDEDDLPTWWTNKVATAVSRLDDMSDYLDTQVEDFTHYPGQVDPKKDKSDGAFVRGDPPEPIEFDGSDTKSILDKANKDVENERGLKQKPFVEAYQLDEKIAGLVKKADKSGMPYSILKKGI